MMDSTTALTEVLDALFEARKAGDTLRPVTRRGWISDAVANLDGLSHWIDSGGALPDVPRAVETFLKRREESASL
jgi:hypothetical protein